VKGNSVDSGNGGGGQG
jgi:hypothetical protein